MSTIRIHVRVVCAETAKPIPGARVCVAWGSRYRPDGGEEGVSDAAGGARFTVRGDGEDDEVCVAATARGRAMEWSGWMDWPDSGVLDVELELGMGPTVIGRVLDPRGQPLSGVGVRV